MADRVTRSIFAPTPDPMLAVAADPRRGLIAMDHNRILLRANEASGEISTSTQRRRRRTTSNRKARDGKR